MSALKEGSGQAGGGQGDLDARIVEAAIKGGSTKAPQTAAPGGCVIMLGAYGEMFASPVNSPDDAAKAVFSGGFIGRLVEGAEEAKFTFKVSGARDPAVEEAVIGRLRAHFRGERNGALRKCAGAGAAAAVAGASFLAASASTFTDYVLPNILWPPAVAGGFGAFPLGYYALEKFREGRAFGGLAAAGYGFA
jgi:hypothetical protein